jgi:hypothetical protein
VNAANVVLALAIVTTGLSCGLLFAYQVSVIPAFVSLPDATYVAAMQAINDAIQNALFFRGLFQSAGSAAARRIVGPWQFGDAALRLAGRGFAALHPRYDRGDCRRKRAAEQRARAVLLARIDSRTSPCGTCRLRATLERLAPCPHDRIAGRVRVRSCRGSEPRRLSNAAVSAERLARGGNRGAPLAHP